MQHENKYQFESIPQNIGHILWYLIQETVGALNHAVNQDESKSLTSTSSSEGAPPEESLRKKAKHVASPTEFPGYGFKLPVKPRSARNMWEVWFGIGPYQN